jgi:hypothetical protein
MAKQSDLSKKLTKQNRSRSKSQGGTPSLADQEAKLGKLSKSKFAKLMGGAEFAQQAPAQSQADGEETPQFPSMVKATMEPPPQEQKADPKKFSALQLEEISSSDAKAGSGGLRDVLEQMLEELRNISDILEGN